ncbi:beta-galactosidase [Paenibacillus selenitireducens]|uniref:Beta-galactosidase n=1 Tax=Paenibacillus selenitireducens TaxID=1324314 RepID=A0A1T2X0E7_9BACL|nr:glycosyl hydrolase [Paenibacillus selenitireducens]OPA73379.1 beta-galactosidase [Paenibacillus selenitireducens]
MSQAYENHDDLQQQFQHPDATFRPQPFWFLNHSLDKDELESQIQSMHEAGVGGVVLHARHGMQTPYLSQEFLETLEFCTQECRKRNMLVWLYDEDNWPSGTLGGKLTREYPQYRMQYLRVEERRYRANAQDGPLKLDFVQYENNELIAIQAYRAVKQDEEWLLYDSPIDMKDQLGQCWSPPDEHDYVVLAFWSCEIAEGITFAQGYYLDTLNPEAVQAFIRMSYEPLLQFKNHFSATVQGVFTDEPGLMIHDGFFGVEAIRTDVRNVAATLPGMVFAWTYQMLVRFERENGYDLTSYLGALLYNRVDGDRTARQQYYDTITRWYVDGYHGAIRTWCERHGLLYIGHTLEEPVWGQARSQGNQTRVLQQFHYAGVDYLTPGIGTKENPHRIVSVKTAASIAQLESKARVICESFGASGHGYSMRQRRLDANFMAFLGVNLFIPHAFYYSFAGYRKTDFPPTEFKHAPHWPHYRAFADYIARLSVLGTIGKRTPEVLLLSPIHTVYQDMFVSGQADMHPRSDRLFSLLSDRMLRNSIDYDYVDECQLREADIREGDGYCFAHGEGTYRILIMPDLKVLSIDIAAQLVTFVRSGGILIAVGTIPHDSERYRQDPEVGQHMASLFHSGQQHGVLNTVGQGHTLYYDWDTESGGGSSDTGQDRLDTFCFMLQGLLRRQAPMDWKVPIEQREDLIMVERRTEGKRFIWMMNWSERDVTMSFDPEGSKSSIELWDLESGQIHGLSVHGEHQVHFAPGELRIFALAQEQTFGNTTTHISHDQRPDSSLEKKTAGQMQVVSEHVLEGAWEFRADSPNVLLLDQWQVTLNDRQSKMNATMPGQTNTYRTTFTMTQELLEYLQAQARTAALGAAHQGRIELVLDDVEQHIPSHIGFLQRRRNIEIFVNGTRQEALSPANWQDKFYQSVDITPSLQVGENELEILMVSLLEAMPALSFPAFIIGPFAVNGRTLWREPEQVTGDWCAAGYPNYSGTACYELKVDPLPWPIDPQEQVWLEAEHIRETATLHVNGSDVGVRLWPPYAWDITPFIHEGQQNITLKVANTLENLYGKDPLPSGVLGQVKFVRRAR